MADTVSHSSLDSATADEFEVVNAEPRLKIPNNGDIKELEKKLSEVLEPAGEQDEEEGTSVADRMASSGMEVKVQGDQPDKPTEEKALDDTSTVDMDATVFTGITYLGSATVNAPRSEMEIYRNMSILNEQTQMAIPVILSVPNQAMGTVYLLDPANQSTIVSYKLHDIMFIARGPTDSDEKHCFAYTCSHGNQEDTLCQCHVFRCDTNEVHVSKILYSFATAFRRLPKSLNTSMTESTTSTSDHVFRFVVGLELREDDGKGGFSACPKDKNVFKLRRDLEKRLVITVTQTSHNRDLKIERCFGLLLSPGRNVKHSDMTLIDMASMGTSNDGKSYIISGNWDPTDPNFQILNTETPTDTRVFLTIAVDLVIVGIQEPVRFLIETKAKIFPINERFWYFSKKIHQDTFILTLKDQENCNPSNTSPNDMHYEVVSIESQAEVDRRKNMALTLSPNKIPSTQSIPTPGDPEEDSENDEPLLSGSGTVSKDVTDENLLEAWHECLIKWHQNLHGPRPKQVHALVKKGVPEALRGEVWQLLVGCHDNAKMLDDYRVLITKDSPCEPVILRDINRTFPAHDYFKETGGIGQDSLYKLSKAYSVYDEEVGYCQGLSFLAAALLLHMPEEQAFCVLVKVMFDYNLRDLFKLGFETLHLKFYQLERLMQDQLPDLNDHFLELALEPHMYASQWFLTLFTAKFPLCTVFHILDLFLCDGIDVIFRVAMALLKTSRKDLLALDFEGALKYFRVTMPKKYRNDDCSHELIDQAILMKISPKKLKKYEKEFFAMKEAERQQENPVDRLERENKGLMEDNMRLETENDDLAHELVTSKIALRNDLDNAEDRCDFLSKELTQTKSLLIDTEEEKKRLVQESSQLKEVCRRELEKSEQEIHRNTAIIADYKQICAQLSERLEKQQASHKDELHRIKKQVEKCEQCQSLVSPDGQFKKVDAPQSPKDLNPLLTEKDSIIRDLELELAQTKLALVEAQCKTQDLTHDLNAAIGEIQESKNTWFQKTLTSIKEVRKDINFKHGSTSASGSKEPKKDGAKEIEMAKM